MQKPGIVLVPFLTAGLRCFSWFTPRSQCNACIDVWIRGGNTRSAGITHWPWIPLPQCTVNGENSRSGAAPQDVFANEILLQGMMQTPVKSRERLPLTSLDFGSSPFCPSIKQPHSGPLLASTEANGNPPLPTPPQRLQRERD